MSSWTYAFRPELDRILEATNLPIRLIAGGLFVGDRAIPFKDNFQNYLSRVWGQVSHRSGRPFSPSLPFDEDWVYDTELACRAVVVAHQLDEERILPFFHRLQDAFYREGADLTDANTLQILADEVGLDGAELVSRLERLDVISTTRAGFTEAHELGATGLPTLLMDTGLERIKVSAGYNSADQVLRSINVLLG